jgi:dCMP deaminase
MSSISINPNRIELDEAYMQMAEIWAQRSKANRLQVGCLIVKDKQIISDGYNGMPAGVEDDV